MIDPKTLDEVVRRATEGLPAGLDRVREDLRKNLDTVLSATLARMDLVSREEFDVQSGVLARTRAKLASLEAKVAELERTRRENQGSENPTNQR